MDQTLMSIRQEQLNRNLQDIIFDVNLLNPLTCVFVAYTAASHQGGGHADVLAPHLVEALSQLPRGRTTGTLAPP